MDELIEKFVSKKLRKKGDGYQLSANSILSGKGFGKMSTVQYYLTDKTGKNSSPSNSKSYYVTDILLTYHVQNGQVLKDYIVSKKIDFPEPVIGDIDWE